MLFNGLLIFSKSSLQRYGFFLYVPNFLSFVNDNLIFRAQMDYDLKKADAEKPSGSRFLGHIDVTDEHGFGLVRHGCLFEAVKCS